MANHLKRGRKGDVVINTTKLPYLGGDIPLGTRGVVYAVEMPGKVFRVKFDNHGPRLTHFSSLAVMFRPNHQK